MPKNADSLNHKSTGFTLPLRVSKSPKCNVSLLDFNMTFFTVNFIIIRWNLGKPKEEGVWHNSEKLGWSGEQLFIQFSYKTGNK